jgi:hypothetical protein
MPQLSAMHLSSSRRYEVQRTYNFEVVISGLSEDITLNVIRFPLPNLSTPAITLSHGNTDAFVAGRAQWDAGELTIRDTIGADIEAQINTWRRMVYNENTDQIGWAADYQKEAIVYQYSPDGTVSRKWKLFGVWPEAVNFGQLDMETSDKKTIAMTLRYNKALRI